MSEPRAIAPVLGTVLLVAFAVLAAVAVGAAVPAAPDQPVRAALSLSVEGPRLVLTHRAGDPLPTGGLRLVVSVEGRRLAHQPPVPFFAARGFVSGPTGPLNRCHDGPWRAGETASLTVAGTNDPVPARGEEVQVRVYVDGAAVADLRATARGGGADRPPPARYSGTVANVAMAMSGS